MILTILGGVDLLSLLNETRQEPIDTPSKPTELLRSRLVTKEIGEKITLNADDQFY